MKTKWNIDPTHSEVEFKIRHLVISNVKGQFKKFTAEAESDTENFENSRVYFSAEVDSINTGNEQRDGHLKSADFFDAANHPKIEFKSTGMERTGDDTFRLKGNLTIRGTTKPIELDVEYGGMTKDPYGNIKAGFAVSGKVNRKDFGLNWSAVTEAGGVVVSDEVRIEANVQFVKVVPAEATA